MFGGRLGFPLKERLGIHHSHTYFNSGVLLMNLTQLRKEISIEKIENTSIELSNRLTFPD